MRHTLRSLTLLPALGVACTQPAPPPVPVAVVPCAVSDVGSVDSSWRQLRASGFTFCVPGSWRPSHPTPDSLAARVWKGNESSVSWDLGRPPSMIAPDVVFAETTSVVTVTRTNPVPPASLPRGPASQPCSQPTNTPFMIGSVLVVVTQIKCQQTWTTTGWSTAPPIYVQGEAHTPKGAELLLAMMQTIRFTAPRR